MVARTLTNSPERDERRPPRQVACLVRVLELAAPRDPGSRHVLDGLNEVELGRGATSAPTRADRKLRLAVADARMSTLHARLVPQLGGWVIEDLGSRNGVFVNGAKLERALLTSGSWIELGRTAFVFMVIDEPRVPDEIPVQGALPATWNDRFAIGLAALARIAPTQVSIVLRGSSGTGKEVLARGIHAASRRSGPMIAVNCGALPDELVESELFGAKKGAFSGATEDRLGLVRSADGGTLLLDEIGDLEAAIALLVAHTEPDDGELQRARFYLAEVERATSHRAATAALLQTALDATKAVTADKLLAPAYVPRAQLEASLAGVR